MDRSPAPARLVLGASCPTGPAREATPFAWPTLALLRSVPAAALQACLTDDHLREVACLVAEDARGQGLSVERLLVELKRVWPGLAEVRQLAAHDATNLLDRLVTRCIRAYYGHGDWGPALDRARAARVGEPRGTSVRGVGDARIA